MSLKECPAPAARTFQPRSAASSIAADSSSIEAGARTAAGMHRWSPVQLRHPARLSR